MYPPEQLVLWHDDELARFISGGSASDALRSAAICRALLVDSPSVLDAANKTVKEKIRFAVPKASGSISSRSPARVVLHYRSLHQDTPGTETVSKAEFLKREVVVLDGKPTSTLDLIRYVCNSAGAVHFGQPKGDGESRLAGTGAGIFIGGLPLPLHAILDVSKTLRAAINPLCEKLRASL